MFGFVPVIEGKDCLVATIWDSLRDDATRVSVKCYRLFELVTAPFSVAVLLYYGVTLQYRLFHNVT